MKIINRFDELFGSILVEGSRIMFLLYAAFALVICLAYQLRAVPYRYTLDYGEAPLVDQAMRLAAGQNIYRNDISTPPYTTSNYPPLYVAVLAISVKAFGPATTFIFGRLVSALSAWVVGLCLFSIVYTVTRDRFAGLCAGLIFLAFPYVVTWSSLARIDLLALALSMAGLSLLVRQGISMPRLVAVSLLLVAAIFTRQSYALAAPLAAFVWLLVQDWRRAFQLAAMVAGLSLILFLVLNVLTSGGFYFHIVTANINEFGMGRLKYNWDRLVDAAALLLIFGGASLFLIKRWNPLWSLAAPYLVGSALSAATIGKIGSNINYLLELCAALSLAAGAILAWSRAKVSLKFVHAVITITLAIAVGRLMHIMLQDYTDHLNERRIYFSELGRLEMLVKEASGPVLADEDMDILTLLGRPLVMQPFEVTQLSRAGLWDQGPVLERIKKNEFEYIIIYDQPWQSERWTPEMLAAIQNSYVLVNKLAGNKVYGIIKPKADNELSACPQSAWRLPSDAALGVQWREGGLDFFSQGNVAKVPVIAVADGSLTRQPEWLDAVAIEHDDPLHPGEKIWSYYNGMMAANGSDSFVSGQFPPGTADLPVKAGQLLGFQGTWSGKPGWPMWLHVHFAVVREGEPGVFPAEISPAELVDPQPYLSLALQIDDENIQQLKCAQP